MVGKNCVAIASDLRLGNQALTIATNFEKVRVVVVPIGGYASRLVAPRRVRGAAAPSLPLKLLRWLISRGNAH